MVRLGVIGAGAWGNNLIRNIAASEHTSLVAVCDSDPVALGTVRSHGNNVRTFSSVDDLLDWGELDGLVIASPPAMHFEHARKALLSGLHVLVEKPMCLTSADAVTISLIARESQRVLMVGHTFLYSNLVREVKRRIVSGELGEIRCIYSQRLNLGRVRRDVDALWNFAPHDISITSFLLNEWPTSVNAQGRCFVQPGADIADVAFFQMDFGGQAFMGGHVSWLDPQKVRRMVVVGSEKMLVYDDIDSSRHIQIYDKAVELEFQTSASDFSDFRAKVRAGDLSIPHIQLVEPLAVEIEHFANCIETGAKPLTDADHGIRVVQVLEAMSKSMKTGGAAIEVPYQQACGEILTRSVQDVVAHNVPKTIATPLHPIT